MKFKQEFQTHLLQDGFPPHWVESAISYGKLKKCIKKVQKELRSLGLDETTLQQLLHTAENEQLPNGNHATTEHEELSTTARYELDNSPERPESIRRESPNRSSSRKPFRPKLLFAVDEETGEPLDARLSEETKEFLHQLAVQEGLTRVRVVEEVDGNTEGDALHTNGDATRPKLYRQHSGTKLIEVPLTSDGEFFSVLHREVSGLATLQSAEKKRLTNNITELGQLLSDLTGRSGSKSIRHDNDEWRKVFDMYLQARIFFSETEWHRNTNDSAAAGKHLREFLENAQTIKFKRKQSHLALQRFVQMNMELLQSLQFQELNVLAVKKIVKKFDKRTGLGVKSSLFSAADFHPLALTADFAKNLSAEVSNRILAVVPLLDDYLCPVCFSIAYRPVKLKCQHIFCIRCMITMQQAKRTRCPMCRSEVVMEADSKNFDPELQKFLKLHFPAEARAKQRETEIEVASERFGPIHDAYCSVM